jgi:hypothetical protein
VVPIRYVLLLRFMLGPAAVAACDVQCSFYLPIDELHFAHNGWIELHITVLIVLPTCDRKAQIKENYA